MQSLTQNFTQSRGKNNSLLSWQIDFSMTRTAYANSLGFLDRLRVGFYLFYPHASYQCSNVQPDNFIPFLSFAHGNFTTL
jgi:hypothetical protein